MPHRRIRSLLAVLLAALAVAGPVPSAPATAATDPTAATGTVVGHVVTTDGSPAAGVPMRLSTARSSGPFRTYSATTDAAGDWTVTGVVPDAYSQHPDSDDWLAGSSSVLVGAGATVVAATFTVTRPAHVRGTVVSDADGTPVAGISVSASLASSDRPAVSTSVASASTPEDGAFDLRLPPGEITVRTAAQFWFSAARSVTLAEGEAVDLGPVALDAAGVITTAIGARSGRGIDPDRQFAVVDGCRVVNAQPSSCPGVELYATVSSLQLAPGRHTVRYEVKGPIGATVRRATRVVDVRAGVQTRIDPVVVRSDPTEHAVVRSGTYRRGRPVTVRVPAVAYVDGARPHLRTTFRVSGRAVVPTSLRWRSEPDRRGVAKDVLVATLPERWSERRSLTVRVVVHGTTEYAGQAARATRLTRTR